MATSKDLKHEPEYIKSRHGMFYARWGFLTIAMIGIFDLGPSFKISTIASIVGALLGFLWLEVGFYRILTKTRTYNKHDRKLLEEFIQLVYLRSSIEFVREHNFRYRHERASIEGLIRYNETYANDPDKQFLSDTVNQLYSNFRLHITEFINEVVMKTYPDDNFPSANSVYFERGNAELESRFEKHTAEINQAGHKLVLEYDKFLKYAKEILFADD